MAEKSRTTANASKVLYRGTSNAREISKADFKEIGIDHETLRWDSQNLFMVPMEQISLSEEEFNRVIGADSDFTVVDGDTKRLPRSHPHENRFQQPGDPMGAIGGSGVFTGGGGSPAGGATGGSTAGTGT